MKSCLYAPSLILVLCLCAGSPQLSAQSDQDSTLRPALDDNAVRSVQPTSSMACGPAGCIVSHDDVLDTTANQLGQPGIRGQAQTNPDGVASEGRDARGERRSEELVLPPEAPTDFEAFVHDTTGSDAPIFGQKLFLNTPADFVAATSLSAPADYLIGLGDQLKIRTWGNVQMDVSATVDRNGQIFIPQVGTLAIAGTRADKVQAIVQSAISRHFRSFDLSVTLGQLRSIQVFVLGHARRPGVYTISSLSTLVNALFASGGPSNTGSMRDVQVKRNGTVVTHFDVYELLLDGDKSNDVHLLPGDIIDIPVVGPQIGVVGDVTQPAIYELKGATSAAEALHLAGGLTAIATIQRASLDRIVDHTHRTVQDFPLNGPERIIPVQGGDVLRVFPVSPRIDDAVTLRGYVGDPGRYTWHAGMRVSDLIPSRQVLLARHYFNNQNNSNKLNKSHPFAAAAIDVENASTTHALTGSQREATIGTPEILAQNSQPDLVNHETEINWNYASIERLSKTDLTTQVLGFALGEAVDHPDSQANKVLEDGDVIVVYSIRDINLPAELRARFVRVDGEINKPGIYRVDDDETLRDLVQKAGGLAPHAYPYAAQLDRESVRLSEEIKLRGLLQRETQEVLSPVNSVSSSDAHGSAGNLELRRAYLQALQQVHPTGRVVLQVNPTIRLADELPTLPLQDGDHFFVPAVPSTVEVLGNVFNQGALRYIGGEHVGDYLNAAGGHTREADKAHDFVLRADGTVLSREKLSRFDKLILYPGDTVVVPGRFKPGFNLYDVLSIAQLTTNLAIAAAAVSALH